MARGRKKKRKDDETKEQKGTKPDERDQVQGTKLEEATDDHLRDATEKVDDEFRESAKLMAESEKKPVWQGQPAVYNPGVCPNCGSSRNVIVKTCAADATTMGGAILQRLHVCKHCGTRFYSVQVVNRVDVGYTRMNKIPVVDW